MTFIFFLINDHFISITKLFKAFSCYIDSKVNIKLLLIVKFRFCSNMSFCRNDHKANHTCISMRVNSDELVFKNQSAR